MTPEPADAEAGGPPVQPSGEVRILPSAGVASSATIGAMATVNHITVTIDCPDPERAAEFWERFVGYTRGSGGDGSPYVTIERPPGVDGPPALTFQRVPEPKLVKARAHLDLFVDHAGPLVREMEAAGAALVSRTEAGEWTTRVVLDPAGQELCVIGPD